MANPRVLVAGASGLVGGAAIRHYLDKGGFAVTGVSRRVPEGLDGAEIVAVDLLDPEACRKAFGAMTDVTHLVYAAVNEKPDDLLEGWRDKAQMQVNLRMLENLFAPLEQAAKGLKHVTLLQGTKAYGAHLGPIPIPARERSPRHPHDNFYWLQEDYLRARQPGKAWAWTILRPQLVIGDAIGSNLDVVPAIGVYAALLKEAGEPLHFPGRGEVVSEMVDVDLLASAAGWAGATAAARNEIYNVTNGDVVSMREAWPVIADALGMKVGADKPLLLTEEMPKHAEAWAAIVRKYGLKAPADIRAFVGGSFALADFYFGLHETAARPVLVSTIKARQHGFHDCMDTEDMLRKWFRHFQDHKLLPPA
jgi:nucleoside-diphosphate-sugar epimerase